MGALIAAFLGWGLARQFHAPQVAFAFPGVVALVPGAFPFRVGIGSLAIAHAVAGAALVAATLSLGFSAMLMIGGIAVRVGAPALLPRGTECGGGGSAWRVGGVVMMLDPGLAAIKLSVRRWM